MNNSEFRKFLATNTDSKERQKVKVKAQTQSEYRDRALERRMAKDPTQNFVSTNKLLPAEQGKLLLEKMLAPRVLANKPVKKDLDKDARDYVDALYGESEDVISEYAQMIIDIAMDTKSIIQKKSDISKKTFVYDLGFRNGKYHGSRDCPTVIITENEHYKSSIMDDFEIESYNQVIDAWKSLKLNKKPKSVNTVPKQAEISMFQDDDTNMFDDVNVFDDVGTDYVPEVKPKSIKSPTTQPQSYFNETEPLKEEKKVSIDLPDELLSQKNISSLIQNSHLIVDESVKEKQDLFDVDMSGKQGLRMMEFLEHDEFDQYGNFNSDSDDEGLKSKNSLLAQGSGSNETAKGKKQKGASTNEGNPDRKLDKEFNQLNKVFKSKYGECLGSDQQNDTPNAGKPIQKESKKRQGRQDGSSRKKRV